MGKADLGEKQVCPNCGSKFYDLNKRPATCPKCQTAFDPSDETVRLKRAKATRAPVYEQDYEDDEEAAPARRTAEVEEGFEEEPEETRELDAEAVEDPVDLGDEEEEPASPDAIPAGFSEAEEGEPDEVAEEVDDGVPLLEEDEEFADEELGAVDDGEEDVR